MLSNSLLMGIDVGGTAVKVALFDRRGHMLALSTRAIAASTPRPGWAEMQPLDWMQGIAHGAREVLSEAGVGPECVAGIGLSAMIGTLVPLDETWHPLRRAIAYYDTRSAAEAEWMLSVAPEIPQVTGNRVTPGNTSMASAIWLRGNEPEAYARARTLAQTGTFVFGWLTGERRVDWTQASFSGVFDYQSMGWSASIAAKLGIDLSLLADVHAPDATAALSGEAASQLGLLAGTPVAVGGIDGAMASLGVGAIHPGDAYDVSGTSEMIAVCLPEPVHAPELLGRWHVVPGIWALIGAISTPGAALRWFRDELYPKGSGLAQDDLYEAMASEAANSPPGANGVIFLPHMMGERAPIWDPHARGVLYGLLLGTTRGDVIRAIMEGAAFAMRHLIELIEAYGGVGVRRATTVGGGSRSRLWRQIKADVWDVTLQTTSVAEASALGAAMTAGVAAGVYSGYDDAVRQAVPGPQETVMPDAERHDAYEKPYQVYRRLYPALAETMRMAAEPSDGLHRDTR